MNFGFLPDEQQPDDYFFGGGFLKGDLLQPDGNWEQYLPAKEVQRQNGLETMNCTVYGTLNAIETMISRIFHVSPNYSERYTGVLAETTKGGNSPHKVAETIRKTGLIPDSLLPFAADINEWDEFYSPKPMTQEYLDVGAEWLQRFEFKHEWVFTPSANLTPEQKMDKLKEALKYSPIAVSVSAWQKDGLLYVKDPGEQDNHWCLLYAIDDVCHIYDSYDASHKRLMMNYDFQFAKLYYIVEQSLPTPAEEVESLFSLLSRVFHTILDKLKTWYASRNA